MGILLRFSCDADDCKEACGFEAVSLAQDAVQSLNRLRGEGWRFRPVQRGNRLDARCPKHASEDAARSSGLQKSYA